MCFLEPDMIVKTAAISDFSPISFFLAVETDQEILIKWL